MVLTRNRGSVEADDQQGLTEVPDSQFGTATLQAQGTPSAEGQTPNQEAMLTMVERLVRERLAQQQHPHTPPVHVMRGNKPQLYYGRSRSEFDEFTRVCESNFLSAHWGPEQNTDKVAYASGFLMGTPANEWKAFQLRINVMTLTWGELKDMLITLLGKNPIRPFEPTPHTSTK